MNFDHLTAIVLNWRTADHTVRAARALIGDGVPRERIVIVDNASGDGSVERFERDLEGCRIIGLDENSGFAGGNNLGARALPADAYLFVNSDAFVDAPGSVRLLLEALDDPSVGVVVPRLRNPDTTLQRSVVPSSTPLPELIRASGLSRFVPNRFQPYLGTHWDHASSRRIQAANGAVLLVRAAAWEQLGGFDERHLMYAEELDLFRRLASHGWKAWFVAEAQFVHLGNASADQLWDDPQRAERVAHAHAAMVRARLGPVRGPLTVGLMAAGVGARACLHQVRGRRATAATEFASFRGFVRR